MIRLDPKILFERIANDIPTALHENLIVTGSLAAAYQFHAKLEGNAVNTKDADLVVHPAGQEKSCVEMTMRLLEIGWTRTEQCHAQVDREPVDQLRAIRLYPPNSSDYFIEFLNVPQIGQQAAREWIPVKLNDGWYGLPSFRFMGVVEHGCIRSEVGIDYASPAMMALANLLSHPRVGKDRMESGPFRGLLRAAKDMGRIIALAFLTGRDDTETWVPLWTDAIEKSFPQEIQSLAATFGDGLRELIQDQDALNDAHKTTDVGLLSGMNVTPANLKATGARLLADVVEPVQHTLLAQQ